VRSDLVGPEGQDTELNPGFSGNVSAQEVLLARREKRGVDNYAQGKGQSNTIPYIALN
jgi:hypothetical protein